MHHILVNIEVQREREREREKERERETLLNLKQNVWCQKYISELFEIITCFGRYSDLSLHIISCLDSEHKK